MGEKRLFFLSQSFFKVLLLFQTYLNIFFLLLLILVEVRNYVFSFYALYWRGYFSK